MTEPTYLGNPNLKRANVQQEWTKKELLEYKRCMDDPLYFIQTYVRIVSLDEGLIPFKMYNFQKRWLGHFITIVLQSANYQDSLVSLQR